MITRLMNLQGDTGPGGKNRAYTLDVFTYQIGWVSAKAWKGTSSVEAFDVADS